jgi:hypothetical protein
VDFFCANLSYPQVIHRLSTVFKNMAKNKATIWSTSGQPSKRGRKKEWGKRQQ